MAVLSAAALAAGIITGCGGASDHTGGESSKAVAGSVTLDFFQMKNEAKSVYDEIIAKFEAEIPVSRSIRSPRQTPRPYF